MEKWSVLAAIGTAILPIVGALVLLYSDVQTMKTTKVEYREVAELKIEMISTLSKNTEAIENLNKLINRMLDGKEFYGKEKSSN